MSNQAEWRKYHEKTKDWDAVYIFEGSELICHAANEEAADELMALHTAARVGRIAIELRLRLAHASGVDGVLDEVAWFEQEMSALDAMSLGGKE